MRLAEMHRATQIQRFSLFVGIKLCGLIYGPKCQCVRLWHLMLTVKLTHTVVNNNDT